MTGSTGGSRRARILATLLLALVAAAWIGLAVATLALELSTTERVAVVTAAALVTEGSLYVGAAFLGIALFARIRARISGGRRSVGDTPPEPWSSNTSRPRAMSPKKGGARQGL